MTPETSTQFHKNAQLVATNDPQWPEEWKIKDYDEEDTRVNEKFLRVIEELNRRGYGNIHR